MLDSTQPHQIPLELSPAARSCELVLSATCLGTFLTLKYY